MEPVFKAFLFEGEHVLRTIEKENAPWFSALDACRAMGTTNPSKAVVVLDEDERSTITFSKGGPPQIIISESGLFTLILRSHDAIKEGTVAHRFRKWVTSEVLPAIRRTGHYEGAKSDGDEGAEDVQSPDGIKLRKINTAARIFGERAGAQMWFKLGMEIVPAMRPMLAQFDLLEIEVTTTRMTGGTH